MGLSEADGEKPKIAIVNRSSDMVYKCLAVAEVSPEGPACGPLTQGALRVDPTQERLR